ncbi:MAG: SurA N-terminal domain-containing protein [Beijerinckiaceae bacterium]|jgi:peptidyl-prolyl cis-trans isomerase D|nr:SurA N-terminal domain-containing protein [Beijerinckiaceae bacterium]
MLESMRRATQNWIGRTILTIVFGILILSFAIWGIGDIFRGGATTTVAKVGDVSISAQDFRNAYQTQLQTLQRQARRAITNEQARAFGLDRQVLSRLVADAALDQKVRELRLAMSDDQIARSILEDPSFKGPDGNFNRQAFNDIIRDNGFTEQTFVREQRRVYLRREIGEAVAGNVPTPQVAVEAIHRYSNETRSVEYVVLPETAAGEIPAPSAEDLQKFYDARKTSYRAPEYRRIVTLAITPQTLADPSKVTDAEARAHYERIKGERFGVAERRELQQMVFPTEDEAKAASEKLKAGASFEDLATERQLSKSDIDLGLVARSALIDPAIAEAAFTTPAGETSAPVQGRFGWALVRVVRAEGGNVQAYEEVADKVKLEVAANAARGRVQQVRDAIEDERTSGRTLAEAAKKAGFEVTTIEGIDAQGRDKTGAEIPLTDKEAVLRAVFASDIGVDNETITTRDNGYVWFEIAGIDPAHDRSLDEVKDQVAASWREEEARRRLSERAAELVKRIDGGETIEKVAAAEGNLNVQSSAAVKRGGAEGLPAGLVAQIFNTPTGKAGSAAGDGASRYVFVVNDSVVPPLDPDSDDVKSISGQLATAYGEDMLSQYLTRLQADLGVSVNQRAMSAAAGGEAF